MKEINFVALALLFLLLLTAVGYRVFTREESSPILEDGSGIYSSYGNTLY